MLLVSSSNDLTSFSLLFDFVCGENVRLANSLTAPTLKPAAKFPKLMIRLIRDDGTVLSFDVSFNLIDKKKSFVLSF